MNEKRVSVHVLILLGKKPKSMYKELSKRGMRFYEQKARGK